MPRKEMSRTDWYPIVMTLIFSAVLVACTPEGQAQETRPAVTQTIEGLEPSEEITIDAGVETEVQAFTPTASQTPEASATPENTPTVTATATPENTAIPEALSQAEIRAEILAAGINLDDLANSENEWARNHLAIDTIQNYIDSLNFGHESESFVTTVVIGLEAVENLEELNQAIETDGGWILTSFAKLAYKDIDGNWQIIKVPLNAYNPENNLFWIKNVDNRNAPLFMDGEEMMKLDEKNNLIHPIIRTWIALSDGAKYHSGPGSFIKLFTGWIENPRYANNDAVLGDYRDLPRYSEQDLIEFRKTGDPSIFGYQDRDGYYIWWPLVTFNADLSELSSYNQE
jgi:hypothetical protein